MSTAQHGQASIVDRRAHTEGAGIGYRCEWLDGATTAVVGARFRGHNRLGKVRWHTDAIVTVADPGREFAFTILHENGREETLWR